MNKKKWASSLLVLGMVSSSVLAGCSKSTTDNVSSASTAATAIASEKPAAPVTLRLAMWESQPDIDFWTEKVKEYTKLKSNVTVEINKVPDNNGTYLKISLAANDLPDVFYMKPNQLQIYKQALLPLDDMNATKANKFAASQKIDGKILGLPMVSFSEYVYYHPSIFNELGLVIPKTLPEFVTLLEKIKASGKYTPLSLGMKDSWTSYPFMEFGPHILSGNGNYLADLPKNEAPFAANTTFDKVAKLLQEITTEKLAGSDPLSISYDQETQSFEAKKSAMIALGQWYYPSYLEKVKSDNDLAAFPLPWRSAESDPLTSMTLIDNNIGISKNSKNLNEAKAFLEWMFSKEVYKTYIDKLQDMSTINDVTANTPFFEKVAEKTPFQPFIYSATDELYTKVKAASQYDPNATAQDIFAGKPLDKLESELNDKWKKAIQPNK